MGKESSAVENESGGYTFVVEESIKPNRKFGQNPSKYREYGEPQTLTQAWKTHAGSEGSIEAMSSDFPNTVAVFTKQNLLAKAVHVAFYDHLPLVLSPDIIWLTIAQGLANHVNQNAETLRAKFVKHKDKKDIVIVRPEFVKGSRDNDWKGVFPEFAEKITANSVSNVAKLIECDFSTTTEVERVASYITLMDTVKHYFSYSVACGCGFPCITLKGTVTDWEKIKAKAETLKNYDLEWWLKGLLPALDQFILAAKGEPDLDFWRSLCNINTGTSFPKYEPLTGWIQVFFPYIYSYHDSEELVRNDSLENYRESYEKKVNVKNVEDLLNEKGKDPWSPPKNLSDGVELELFPGGISIAPFKYNDYSTRKQHDMSFCSGIVSLIQYENGAIEPKVGWAVLDSGIERPL